MTKLLVPHGGSPGRLLVPGVLPLSLTLVLVGLGLWSCNPSRLPARGDMCETPGGHMATVDALKDLPGVGIMVEMLSDDARALGLSEVEIRRWVSDRLQRRGVPILECDGLTAYLYINVGILGLTDELSVFAINAELQEPAVLLRLPDREVMAAAVWNRGLYGTARSRTGVRRQIEQLIDDFSLHYVEARSAPEGKQEVVRTKASPEPCKESCQLEIGPLRVFKVGDSSLGSTYAFSAEVTNSGEQRLTLLVLTYTTPPEFRVACPDYVPQPVAIVLDGFFDGPQRGPIEPGETVAVGTVEHNVVTAGVRASDFRLAATVCCEAPEERQGAVSR